MVDFLLQVFVVAFEFRGGFTDNHDGGVGVVFEDGNGGLDEQVDSLGRADATENADAKAPRESEGLPGCPAVGRWLVALQVDAVGNDDIGG